MERSHRLVQVEDYEQFVGAEAVERVRDKAQPLQGLHAEIIYHFRCAQCRRNVQNLIFETLASFFTQIRIAAGEMYCLDS